MNFIFPLSQSLGPFLWFVFFSIFIIKSLFFFNNFLSLWKILSQRYYLVIILLLILITQLWYCLIKDLLEWKANIADFNFLKQLKNQFFTQNRKNRPNNDLITEEKKQSIKKKRITSGFIINHLCLQLLLHSGHDLILSKYEA